MAAGGADSNEVPAFSLWHDECVPPENLGEVLVVRLGAIGDVTNALVFATALKAAHPQTRIGWVVHSLRWWLCW